MKIFAVDSSSTVAACAIMDDDRLMGEYILNHGLTHSQTIMPMINEMMESCQLKAEDIDVYAVAKGPGSFTGLRIGVASIKGIAHAVNKPVVGISTLDALAFNIPFSEGIVVPIMDARRDRVYTGIYKWENGNFYIIEEAMAIEIDELMAILKKRTERVIFNGDGTLVYKERIFEHLGDRALFAPKSVNMARASSVAELAYTRAKEGKLESFFDLVPEYLRESQAQRQYREKKELCGDSNE